MERAQYTLHSSRNAQAWEAPRKTQIHWSYRNCWDQSTWEPVTSGRPTLVLSELLGDPGGAYRPGYWSIAELLGSGAPVERHRYTLVYRNSRWGSEAPPWKTWAGLSELGIGGTYVEGELHWSIGTAGYPESTCGRPDQDGEWLPPMQF